MEIVRRKEPLHKHLRYVVRGRPKPGWLTVALILPDFPEGDTHPYEAREEEFEPDTPAKLPKTVLASKDNVKDRKPPYRYISKELLDQCAYAMLAGETKYGAWNYLKGHTALQLIEAMERHLAELKSGIDFDKDCSERIGKQVHHLGNVLANANMYLTQLKVGTLVDDRPEQITNAYKPAS